ncbi:hypothetical protein B0O99DRAFT_589513 [Bisporella sp. PMI_857]|nr:hypothetical protein B0O99DRAFT_589513 [Bisporella sp. PMI_857]
MQFTTSSLVSIFAFAAMVQPSIQAAAALRVGASLVGGMASGGNHKRDAAMQIAADYLLSSVAGVDKRIKIRGQAQGKGGAVGLDAKTTAQLEKIFKQCMTDVKDDGKRTVDVLREEKTNDAKLTGLPTSCTTAANTVNALPNIDAINKAQGTMTVVGTDTIILKGEPVQRLAKQLVAADKKGAKNSNKNGAKEGVKKNDAKPAAPKPAGSPEAKGV